MLLYSKGKVICFTEGISIKGNKAAHIFNVEIQHKARTNGTRLLAEEVTTGDIKNYLKNNCKFSTDDSDLKHTFHVTIV